MAPFQLAFSFAGASEELPVDWLPGEYLFSLAARFHKISGNSLQRHTALQLFDEVLRGSPHHFAAVLSSFVFKTAGRAGRLDQVIQNHTIYPHYLPFLNCITPTRWSQSLEFGGVDATTSLNSLATLLSLGIRPRHRLRSCLACARQDSRDGRPPYWRRNHQYPGVWCCQTHGERLIEDGQPITGNAPLRYWLPAPFVPSSQTPASLVEMGSPTEIKLRALTDTIISMASLPIQFRFDPEKLRRLYLAKIGSDENFAENPDQAIDKFSRDFWDWVAPMSRATNSTDFPSNLAKVQRLIADTLKNGFASSALRHLLIVEFAFGGSQMFLQSYSEVK